MSKLATALADQARPRKGPPCSIGVALTTLPAGERSDLRDALADPNLAHIKIARALRTIDVQIAASSISRHRRGDCVCPR